MSLQRLDGLERDKFSYSLIVSSIEIEIRVLKKYIVYFLFAPNISVASLARSYMADSCIKDVKNKYYQMQFGRIFILRFHEKARYSINEVQKLELRYICSALY